MKGSHTSPAPARREHVSEQPTSRSMVRALRYRVLVVVAAAAVLMSVASVWGLRIVTDRNAERQVHVAAQSVTTWGADEEGVKVIDSVHFSAVDTASTIVALIGSDGHVVVATSGASVTVSKLESIAMSLETHATVRADVGSRTFLFTRIPLAEDVVFDDGDRTQVVTALVGTGVEGSDRLVSALALAALGLLALIIVTVAIVVTVVVTRTTRSLTDLASRVEAGNLDNVAESAASEYTETAAIARAIERLDVRRDATERQLRDFVADASHELRTPLTKIQGWSELHFQRPSDAETTDRAFQSVVDESARMGRLIDRLAQLARAESQSFAHERVDLAAICRAGVDDAALMESDTKIRIEAPSPVWVVGDAEALTQVVRNLIGNALHHAGPEARITVRLEDYGHHTELSVSDDGRGMPQALRDKAFDRFVTGNRRTGTGLGLAIVQAIAVAHGGTVELTSELGEGTSVRVRLPAAPQ